MKPTQSISRLFNKITSTNKTNDCYCLKCFESYRTENKLEEHELICENNKYCEMIMPDEKNKILRYANGTKSLKMEHAIYLDLECLLVKHNTCANNPNSSYSKTIPTHEPSGYSIVVVSRHISSYQMHYREEHCINKLSSDLLTIGERIANEEKKR